MKWVIENYLDRVLMILLVIGLWVSIVLGHVGEAQRTGQFEVAAKKVSGLEDFIHEVMEDCEVLVLNLGVSTTIECS